jgi:hypothetical protein
MADEITAGRTVGSLDAVALQGREIALTAPTNGQTIVWNSTLKQWVPSTPVGGGGVVDGQQIFDGSHVLAGDFGTRELVALDTGVMLDFSNTNGNGAEFPSGAVITLISSGVSGRNVGNADGVLNSGSGVSIDWASRQLIANDGSTVALNWSDPTVVSFGVPANTQLRTTQITSGFGDEIIGGNAGDDTWRWWSSDHNTYFDNSGFHGIGAVIAGTKTATGAVTTTFTVTIGATMANNTYKVSTEGGNALSAAIHYVNNKTTTTFDVVYLTGLTGSVAFDWIVTP